MSNVLEYILRLRDEFSATARNAASSSQSSLSAIGGGALLIADNFDVIAQRSGQAFGVLTGHYDQLGSLLGALPGPIGVVGSVIGQFIGGAVTDVLEAADAFDKLSQKTGMSVEFLSGFTEASDDVRVSSDAVENSLLKFARGLGGLDEPMDGAIAGGKGVAGTLKDLNIQAFDTTGKMRPMEEVLLDVSDVFHAMPDGPEKSALAVQLFGKSGTDLIPILNKGSTAIGEMMQSAKAMGLVITADTVAAMDRLKRSQDEISDSWDGIVRQIGADLLPIIGNLTTGINLYLTEAGKAKGETDLLTRMTTGADLAFRLFTGALKDTEGATKNEKQATQDATGAMAAAETAAARLKDEQNRLKDKINDTSRAFGGQTAMMTDMELAQLAFQLATGKVTLAELEQTTAYKALTKAYQDGDVDFQTVVKTTTDLYKGNISVEEALKKAGKAGEKYAAELAGVKYNAELANSKSADFKRTLDTIPATKSTVLNALVTGATEVSTLKVNIDGIPASKSTVVAASVTGKQEVDYLAQSVNGIPYTKRTDVTANTIDAQEMYDLWGWVNGIPGSKSSTVTANVNNLGTLSDAYYYVTQMPGSKTTNAQMNTYGVYGYNSLQDAADHINALKNMGLNLGVNTTVTVLGYTPNSPMPKKGGASSRASGGGPLMGDVGGWNVNAPMTVNVRNVDAAAALAQQVRSLARRASMAAALG